MNRSDSLLRGLAAVAALTLSRPGAAQCALQWQPGDAIPCAHGDAAATTVWDADGAGPTPAILVVGGRFGVGNQLVTSLATFDGTSWGALATPPLPKVTALTTWNGLLVAAGGTGNQHAVATWNGTAWSVIGSLDGPVKTMIVWNSELFVGGLFAATNSVLTRNLARWNGTAWSEPGGGVIGEVSAMTVFGSLYVGGLLTSAGATAVANLAIWNGTTWSAGATFNGRVRSLAARNGLTTATSFVIAGGEFTTVAGVPAQHVARFTASTGAWTAIPGLPGTACSVVNVRATGQTTFQLLAAVEDASSSAKVWRLSGSTWQSLGPVFDETEPLPTSLVFFNGQPMATFAANQIAPAALSQAVRMHDGTVWQGATGAGFDEPIHAIATFGGELVIGGAFRHYGTNSLEYIARGGPGAWQSLGAGITGGTGVHALCTLANGDVVAGGDFTTAGGVATDNIAQWNGATWTPLGSGIVGTVFALLALPDGGLIAAGAFPQAGGVAASNIARWNGTSWAPLGAGTNGIVLALARRSDGDVFATGGFSFAGGAPASRIARWNGTSWATLGSGIDAGGFALAVLADDSVVVGGHFLTAGGIFTPSVARWSGTSWFAQSIPTSAWDADVASLVALPDGDYIAGGQTSFFGLGGIFGGSNQNLARHTGAASSLSWSALDLRGIEVSAAFVLPNGDLVFGGRFDGAGGLASQNVAVLRSTCPASASAYGSGCTGSGGAEVLRATALPWTGGAFRARATGMPGTAIALAVTGFTQLALPLPAVLPQGVPGCSVLVSPDLLDAVLPVGGIAMTQLALPDTMTLAGQSFHHQVVPLEVDLAGNIVTVTSTNGLTLTIGVL